jgi:hypothetical protein
MVGAGPLCPLCHHHRHHHPLDRWERHEHHRDHHHTHRHDDYSHHHGPRDAAHRPHPARRLEPAQHRRPRASRDRGRRRARDRPGHGAHRPARGRPDRRPVPRRERAPARVDRAGRLVVLVELRLAARRARPPRAGLRRPRHRGHRAAQRRGGGRDAQPAPHLPGRGRRPAAQGVERPRGAPTPTRRAWPSATGPT